MDVESIIDDIEQLQEMFEAPDSGPFSATTSALRIAGTMKHLRTALGSSCGSIMVSAADLNLR
jgi:hypothetical protein